MRRVNARVRVLGLSDRHAAAAPEPQAESRSLSDPPRPGHGHGGPGGTSVTQELSFGRIYLPRAEAPSPDAVGPGPCGCDFKYAGIKQTEAPWQPGLLALKCKPQPEAQPGASNPGGPPPGGRDSGEVLSPGQPEIRRARAWSVPG
jgi:hypothetical protein